MKTTWLWVKTLAFGYGYHPILDYFKGFWDVHQGTVGVLTHGHLGIFIHHHRAALPDKNTGAMLADQMKLDMALPRLDLSKKNHITNNILKKTEKKQKQRLNLNH